MYVALFPRVDCFRVAVVMRYRTFPPSCRTCSISTTCLCFRPLTSVPRGSTTPSDPSRRCSSSPSTGNLFSHSLFFLSALSMCCIRNAVLSTLYLCCLHVGCCLPPVFVSVCIARICVLFRHPSNLASSTASSQEQALFAEQREWLQRSLLASDAMFKFVYFHHAPFCTAQHDPLGTLRCSALHCIYAVLCYAMLCCAVLCCAVAHCYLLPAHPYHHSQLCRLSVLSLLSLLSFDSSL